MFNIKKTAAVICLTVLICSVAAGGAFAAKRSQTPKPSYPPLPNEYYPISNSKYPKAATNPNPHTRNIEFKGKTLDIYTKINMVTQLVLPSAPVLVTVGKPDAFTIEVVPEFNTLFLKPVREVEMTNLIVTTESDGVYIFMLKENPFIPWDIRVQITDPYKQIGAGDTQSMVAMLYQGKRAPEFQFVPMDMRTPNTSAFVYDPLTRMGCSIKLRRAIAMPKAGVSAYWVEFKNILPGNTSIPSSSYSISEQSVYAKGLMKVAVPGLKDGSSTPILSKGDKTYMFMLIRDGVIPKMFKFRFALMGAKNLPIDVTLPTVGAQKPVKLAAKKTDDEKLQSYYDMLVQSGQIKPQTEEEALAAQKAEQDAAQKKFDASQSNNQVNPADALAAPVQTGNSNYGTGAANTNGTSTNGAAASVDITGTNQTPQSQPAATQVIGFPQ